ncbi:MAG TPA: hypothetical protein VL737_03895 [Candidatus Pristimantibacillus sp.]|nr:hypothetical protein [Candidatus Pristimantibacillus sp.]
MLNGVNDLAGSAGAPVSDNGAMQMDAPADPAQSGVPAVDDQQAEQPAMNLPAPASMPAAAPASEDSGDLLDIKQQALQQLTPLVGHLDQKPEDRFRTTMMLIQASDNQALLKDAYDAAQAIEDEKVRAQALLDVINEINYFTQNNKPEA